MFPTLKELDELSKASVQFRRALTAKSLHHFFAYYFNHYITSPFSKFHDDMAHDLMELANGTKIEVAEITYRSSSKTSLAKAFTAWCIVNGTYPYLNIDSYDGTNSERFLFDVVIELQTNQRLIYDYGHLFNFQKDPNEKTQKRIKDFLTSNGIRCEAHTTQEPVRGRLHGHHRPSLLQFDDIETRKVINSEAAMRQVREHIAEAKPGMDQKRHSLLYLGNYLSETGNIQHIIDRLTGNPDATVRIVPIVEGAEPVWVDGNPEWKGDGRPTWPERFCMTDEEQVQSPEKISLQKMRREMWNPDTGEAEFLLEMMCRPSAYSNRNFHRGMFTDIDFTELKKRKTRVFLTVDAGGSSDDDDLTGKDRCGFTVNWVEADGHWNLKAWGERLGPTALVTRIIDTMCWLTEEGTPCHQFAWEKTQYTAALKSQLYAEMRHRNRMFPVVEIQNVRRKEERIKGALLHRYETGMIRHVKDECKDLEVELLMFPEGKHDDVIDSASFMAGVVPMVFNHNAKSNGERVSKFVT